MKKLGLVLVSVILLTNLIFAQKDFSQKVYTDANGFKYTVVNNDPFGVRIYTLENGLKVYLSDNKEKPKVSTMIAVKAGSTYDPAETTGLAHYLEHMMFKGSTKIGTVNWEAEEKALNQISDLFEKKKLAKNKNEKTDIYKNIDKLSQEASKYAVPNEYDKAVSLLGASGTNAFTSNEMTVYMNTIPSNAVERWLALESERFSQLVLRLFHTELETVYEEFNTSQSNDYRIANKEFNKLLFPTHPYGTQTTLGKAEHLKNPSMVNIHKYWDKYYRANNMAIIMVGDLDFDRTINQINTHFGRLRTNKELSHPVFAKEKPIISPKKSTVYGPGAEFVNIGFRLDGVKSDDKKYTELIDMILSNGQAGLIDLDLIKKQKVLRAYSYTSFKKDYGQLTFSGYPIKGQSLEDVEKLLLAELDKIKDGNFDEWLIEAIINQKKLEELQKIEQNYYIYDIMSSFVLDVPWKDQIKGLDELAKITKEELIEFANKKFKNNYVVVYKKTGENKNIVYVDKPTITPIKIDRTKESIFYQNFKKIEDERLNTDFINYKENIKQDKIDGVDFNYIQNVNNELSSINFIFEMGGLNMKELSIAIEFFEYLGTETMSSEQISKEYFKMGVYTGVSAGSDRSYIYLSGLNENFNKALPLFINNIKTAKADRETYTKFVESYKKKRADNKLSKYQISSKLGNYAKYGKENPSTFIISNEELDNLDPNKLVSIIKNILDYKHIIFYYGPKEFNEIINVIASSYSPKAEFIPYPEKMIFEEQPQQQKVYFVNYDMVQSNVTLIAKDEMFNVENAAHIRMFNEFYGSGLSSIVFQEIRESKGLVYSAYSYMTMPYDNEKSHYLVSALNTQPDKIDVALTEFYKLLNNIPDAKKQFDASKQSILRNLESKRVIKESIFWNYLRLKKIGIENNIDEQIYSQVNEMTYETFTDFFNKHIANKKFDILVVGKKENLDFEMLKKYGTIQELSLKEIFNY